MAGASPATLDQTIADRRRRGSGDRGRRGHDRRELRRSSTAR